MKEAALRLLQEDARFRAAVREGVAQADRGEFIEEDRNGCPVRTDVAFLKMQLRWTPAAVADLEHISDYLKEHHPRYRQPTIRKLYDAVVSLKKWPERGRIGREEGTREFLFSPLPYVVVYRLTGRSVEVLRIYHTAQDRRPKLLNGA